MILFCHFGVSLALSQFLHFYLSDSLPHLTCSEPTRVWLVQTCLLGLKHNAPKHHSLSRPPNSYHYKNVFYSTVFLRSYQDALWAQMKKNHSYPHFRDKGTETILPRAETRNLPPNPLKHAARHHCFSLSRIRYIL